MAHIIDGEFSETPGDNLAAIAAVPAQHCNPLHFGSCEMPTLDELDTHATQALEPTMTNQAPTKSLPSAVLAIALGLPPLAEPSNIADRLQQPLPSHYTEDQ